MEGEMPKDYTYLALGDSIAFGLDFQPQHGSIDALAVDPTNPNAEVNHSEFSVVKLLDAATPKVLPAVQDDCLLLPAVQTDDTFDFKLTTEPTAPGSSVHTGGMNYALCDGSVRTGEGFDALAVDPSNPNAEGRHVGDCELKVYLSTHVLGDGSDGGIIIDYTPGPDDNAGLPAVQTDDGDSAEAVHTPGALLFSFDREPTAQAQTDDRLLLPAVQKDDAATMTAIALAESGGNTDAHNPHGEDSRGLWQINVDPAQTNDVQKGEWITDVTYQSVDLLGQPATETLTIAHEGFL
jgi:prepilin-type processing-associated H-X9-DG protein